MIVPTKHINFSQSLLGFGSYILKKIEVSKSIDDIWKEYQYDYKNNIYLTKHTFDKLLLTITFLYSIGAIEEKEGGIYKCNC
jgi:hypothetical protein